MRSCEPSLNDHTSLTDNNTNSDFSVAGFNRFNSSDLGGNAPVRELAYAA
jgi:hypothetical protein